MLSEERSRACKLGNVTSGNQLLLLISPMELFLGDMGGTRAEAGDIVER
jgi:hypothetical protein